MGFDPGYQIHNLDVSSVSVGTVGCGLFHDCIIYRLSFVNKFSKFGSKPNKFPHTKSSGSGTDIGTKFLCQIHGTIVVKSVPNKVCRFIAG